MHDFSILACMALRATHLGSRVVNRSDWLSLHSPVRCSLAVSSKMNCVAEAEMPKDRRKPDMAMPYSYRGSPLLIEATELVGRLTNNLSREIIICSNILCILPCLICL